MIDELRTEIEQFNHASAAKDFAPAISRKAGVIEIRGRRLVDFTNWDVFGLNEIQAFKRAVQLEIEHSGIGVSSSRTVSGTRQAHLTCEARIAAFLGCEAALLFSSKNQAILSLITALATERDAVLSDELSQSPVADACYLSGAQAIFFDSLDPVSLEAELKKLRSSRKFVFIESIQGITGETSHLNEIQPLCAKNSALLCVDESFALGLSGNRGAGSLDLWPLVAKPLVQYADAALSLACSGAFLAGPRYLVNHIAARSKTFTTEAAPLPALAAGIEYAIEQLEVKLLERQKIAQFGEELRRGFKMHGFLPFGASGSPITSIPFDTFGQAREFEEALLNKGFLGEAIPCPTFLENRAVVRFLPSTAHSPEQIQGLLEASSEIWPRLRRR